MRKSKLAKVASVILAGAATVAIGLTAGCKKGDKHNWSSDWEYNSTHHWHECLDENCDEKKDEAAHVDANNDGKCDECKATMPSTNPGGTNPGGTNPGGTNPGGTNPGGTTDPGTNPGGNQETTGKNEYTVYLYAPEVATGTTIKVSVWGKMEGAFDLATMSSVTNETGWYSYTFKTDKEISDGANFNYYIGETTAVSVTGYTTDANWVYFISNHVDDTDTYNVYGSKEAAVIAYNKIANPVDPDAPKAYSYTFYMYAPDATTVTIDSWSPNGEWNGEIAEGTKMTAVGADHPDWYSYTLKTDVELKDTNGINLNIKLDGDNKGKYANDSTLIYFIPVGNDRGFTSFEAAKEKYDELTAPVDPSEQEDVTISIAVDTTAVSGDVYIYVYGDEELFEGWPGEKMTLVSGSTYSVTFKAKKTLSGSYNIIINNNNGKQYDLATITVTDGTWSCPNSAVTITKA